MATWWYSFRRWRADEPFRLQSRALRPGVTTGRCLPIRLLVAYASFEGWVRNHNDGRGVVRLEYEGYEQLGVKEGERIVAEALRPFPMSAKAHCVHRLGMLEIGDAGSLGGRVGGASGCGLRSLSLHHR